MTNPIEEIVENARSGSGPCAGCPAHRDTGGEYVNPGLLNYEADIMILTMDPSHSVDWDAYDSWDQYNAKKGHQFKTEWPGGSALNRLLSEVPGVTLDDVWLADTVKCPVENAPAGDVDTDMAFEHCATYLEQEIADVDPKVIVAMSGLAARKVLSAVFDRDVDAFKPGSRDCGTVFETDPPVVISPHWSYGWLGRNDNREKVREALRECL